MIKFRCPNCSQNLKVPESQSGKKGVCPSCDCAFRVPSQSEQTSQVTQSPGSKAQTSPKAHKTKKKSPQSMARHQETVKQHQDRIGCITLIRFKTGGHRRGYEVLRERIAGVLDIYINDKIYSLDILLEWKKLTDQEATFLLAKELSRQGENVLQSPCDLELLQSFIGKTYSFTNSCEERSAHPVCDVCNERMRWEDGYVLNTNQVVVRQAYWENVLKHQWSYLHSMDRKGDSLGWLVKNQSTQSSGWLICEQCSFSFIFDNCTFREKLTFRWLNSADAGPGLEIPWRLAHAV